MIREQLELLTPSRHCRWQRAGHAFQRHSALCGLRCHPRAIGNNVRQAAPRCRELQGHYAPLTLEDLNRWPE